MPLRQHKRKLIVNPAAPHMLSRGLCPISSLLPLPTASTPPRARSELPPLSAFPFQIHAGHGHRHKSPSNKPPWSSSPPHLTLTFAQTEHTYPDSCTYHPPIIQPLRQRSPTGGSRCERLAAAALGTTWEAQVPPGAPPHPGRRRRAQLSREVFSGPSNHTSSDTWNLVYFLWELAEFWTRSVPCVIFSPQFQSGCQAFKTSGSGFWHGMWATDEPTLSGLEKGEETLSNSGKRREF